MTQFIARSLVLAMAMLVGSARMTVAQTASMERTAPGMAHGMAMSRQTLLVAQLNGAQVAGGGSSQGTGTGAFLLDGVRRTLAYNLTYQGLKAAPERIALYNFGKGGNGDLVEVLCGAGARACPSSGFGTISGSFARGGDRALDNKLIGEFDTGRIYVEIVGADGKRAIRGQLGANGAMVPVANYVAHLAPVEGSGAKGDGTVIVSETYLPGGKVSVFYTATVAGASSPPTNMAFVWDGAAAARAFTPRLALPRLELHGVTDNVGGGSLSGAYDVDSSRPDALFASRLASGANGEVGIIVTTNLFPKGELYGVLARVR